MKIPKKLEPSYILFLLSENKNFDIPDIGFYKNIEKSKDLQLLKNIEDENKKESKEFYDENKGLEDIIQKKEIFDYTRNYKTDTKKFYLGSGFTNAWRKMYEVCYKTRFIPDKKYIRSLDLCGFPGSFTLVVNHYLKSHTDNEIFDWYIQSYKEDDKKLYREIADNFPERILIEKNGDITSKKEIDYLKNFFSEKKCDIVFSDCGHRPDFESALYNREIRLMKIFFGQYIAGISVLKKGGNFLMKNYSFYENFSVSLIYLMSLNFKKVYLIKPESSRQFRGHEIYIMCMGFKDNLSEKKYRDLTDKLDKFKEKDKDCSLISYNKMDKEVLEKISKTIAKYYRIKIQKRKMKQDFIDNFIGVDYNKDKKKFLERYNKLHEIVKRNEIKWFKNYFKRMDYKKIDKQDKIIS